MNKSFCSNISLAFFRYRSWNVKYFGAVYCSAYWHEHFNYTQTTIMLYKKNESIKLNLKDVKICFYKSQVLVPVY